jgi:hypothetical protein
VQIGGRRSTGFIGPPKWQLPDVAKISTAFYYSRWLFTNVISNMSIDPLPILYLHLSSFFTYSNLVSSPFLSSSAYSFPSLYAKLTRSAVLLARRKNI